MIRFESATARYRDTAAPVFVDVDLAIPEGELWVVTGPTGCGKSTLLSAVNGLMPRFTGGTLHGRITVEGRDTASHPPREFADLVGFVAQDPSAGFVTDTVEDELAYVLEQLAVGQNTMRTRVEEALDLLGLAGLRRRSLAALSAGEQQRVAIGSVFTAHPRVLVLDEPTSALDPTAAEEVLAALVRIVHDLGVTVLASEHRLERVIQYADGIVTMSRRGEVESGPPAERLESSDIAPPVVELGRLADWRPLPTSVRDARRRAGALRTQLSGLTPSIPFDGRGGRVRLEATGVTVRHGGRVAVGAVDVSVAAGEVVCLMGRNGAGKTSLLWALHGGGPRHAGSVSLPEPDDLPGPDPAGGVGLVPHNPTDILFLETVEAELQQADIDAGATPGTAGRLLATLVDGIPLESHPRDLSEGQRLALVLAIQLASCPAVMLLDEPTRGLDYRAKDSLRRALRRLAGDGRGVLVSTHDVEFAALVSDRVVVMSEGEVVADGPTGEVLLASPAFAPQVAKVLAPQPWLTVEQVAEALDAS